MAPTTKLYQNEAEEVFAHVLAITGNVPTHRQESKKQYSFSGLSFNQQLTIWDTVWRETESFWIRIHATFFLERHMKKEAQLREMWPVIVSWQNQVDDWGLCDALAKVYTRMLEVMPGEVYAQLTQWNTDADLWKRRQSVVSLLYYSRTKKLYLSFDEIVNLIGPLISDKEYYVQKGVGWALRELHNVYPVQARAFLKEHIKTLSSIAFSTAIEKIDVDTVTELKMARKATDKDN